MARAEAPKPLTIKDFVGTQKPEIEEGTGNKIYRALDGSIALIVSSIAFRHISDEMDLLRLMDKPSLIARAKKRVLPKRPKGLPSNVTREDAVRHKLYIPLRQGHYHVAVKHFDSSAGELTGIEQFRAMSQLQEKLVLCALPLAATEATLITKWVDPSENPQPTPEQVAELPAYLLALGKIVKQLKGEGKWQNNWKIDENPDSYAVRHLNAKDPLWRFIALDPVHVI